MTPRELAKKLELIAGSGDVCASTASVMIHAAQKLEEMVYLQEAIIKRGDGEKYDLNNEQE